MKLAQARDGNPSIPRDGNPLNEDKSCSTDVIGLGTVSTVGAAATATLFAAGFALASTGACCLLAWRLARLVTALLTRG